MENNNKLSVTPLTDDEVKKFNREVDCILCSPVRNNIKDALDAILFTIKCYYRWFQTSDTKFSGVSFDETIDAITKLISSAMRIVDGMDVTELRRIAERADYAHAAFKLVGSCLPDGMLLCKDQLNSKNPILLRARYLRKILDICRIVGLQTDWYTGADINYYSATYLKSKLAECPGGKTLADPIKIPSDPGYVIYGNEPVVQNVEYPSVISTLKQWADENVDDSCRDKFFAFVMRHESDIFNYGKVHRPDLEKVDEVCLFFYRWFLKEQASK